MSGHPELQFQEKYVYPKSRRLAANPWRDTALRYAHDALTAFMEKHGWNVERQYHLETAWVATFSHGNGGRVLGVNSEMDALPGIGHACGHNLIAIAGVAVALAIKAALIEHDIPGKVILLGTPGIILYFYEGVIFKINLAEEGGQGKVILLKKGAYKEMHACLM
jgi:metal-dependent amidase/aminoacylase/carboxypeptidase family protein